MKLKMKINKKKIFFVVILPILIVGISLIIFLVNKNKSVENNNENLIENAMDENTLYENITDKNTIIDNDVSNIDKSEVEHK